MAGIATTASPSFGQAASATPPTEKEQEAKVDTEAKDITSEIMNTNAPAFAAIGVSGQTITDPEGLKKLAIALLNGTDTDGNPLTGIGFQFAPAQILGRISNKSYRTNWGLQALARVQVTAAYAKATAGDAGKPERAAIGAIWVPFDTGDPYANTALHDCLLAKFPKRTPVGQDLSKIPATGVDVIPELEQALADCRDQYGKTPTNSYSAQIGFAKLLRSKNSDGTGPLVAAGFAASGVVSIGLDCVFKTDCGRGDDLTDETKSHVGGKLVLGAVFRERELVQNPLDKTKFVDRNRQSYGGRLIVGDPTKWYLGVEFLRQHATYSGLGKDNYTTYNLSLDYKLKDGVWLSANYGDSSGENFSKSSQFTAGFKFSLQPSLKLDRANDK